jgi:hypothetical protein
MVGGHLVFIFSTVNIAAGYCGAVDMKFLQVAIIPGDNLRKNAESIQQPFTSWRSVILWSANEDN